jgi:arylsulfatase A-like enzyme
LINRRADDATPERHDGDSFLPLLRHPSATLDREAIYWHFPGDLQADGPGKWRTTPAGAVRAGGWKLIEFFEDDRVELYNLETDLGERNNLAESEPETHDRLHAMFRQCRRAVEAPMPRRE